MVRLDGSLQKILYTTDSNAKAPEAKYDMLVIRDDTGTVARFEKMRGDQRRIDFLARLLDDYEELFEVGW